LLESNAAKMSLRSKVEEMIGEGEELHPAEVTTSIMRSLCSIVQQPHFRRIADRIINWRRQKVFRGIH